MNSTFCIQKSLFPSSPRSLDPLYSEAFIQPIHFTYITMHEHIWQNGVQSKHLINIAYFAHDFFRNRFFIYIFGFGEWQAFLSSSRDAPVS